MKVTYFKSPIGYIKLMGNEKSLISAQFIDSIPKASEIDENLVLFKAKAQLEEFFTKKRYKFDLHLSPKGTSFQKKVWLELSKIEYGKTISYKDIAKKLGDPKVIRAAASANGKNPIAIIIPCHRVIGSDGSLIGYAGGMDRKKWLLDLESPIKQGTLF